MNGGTWLAAAATVPHRDPPHRSTTRKTEAVKPGESLSPANESSGTVLLVIDMISSWQFPDADRLLPHAVSIAPAIAALQARCRRAGVPVIFANDNQGRWRSDFRQTVQSSIDAGGPGARITSLLHPEAIDYFVLKPKHSAFFATPLELLLRDLKAERLIVTGVSSDQCVLATVAEARMRDFEVQVPSDCVATQSAARNARALTHLRDVQRIRTPRASSLRLRR